MPAALEKDKPRRADSGAGEAGRNGSFRTPYHLARAFLRARLCPIPIRRDGSKAPALPSWARFQEVRPADDEVRAWFDCDQPPGIALVGGKVSDGLLVLDFEFLDFYEEWLALVEAQAPGLALRL